jgi:hypothetical protein
VLCVWVVKGAELLCGRAVSGTPVWKGSRGESYIFKRANAECIGFIAYTPHDFQYT